MSILSSCWWVEKGFNNNKVEITKVGSAHGGENFESGRKGPNVDSEHSLISFRTYLLNYLVYTYYLTERKFPSLTWTKIQIHKNDFRADTIPSSAIEMP